MSDTKYAMAPIPTAVWITIGTAVTIISVLPAMQGKMTIFGIAGVLMILWGLLRIFMGHPSPKHTPAKQHTWKSHQQDAYYQSSHLIACPSCRRPIHHQYRFCPYCGSDRMTRRT